MIFTKTEANAVSAKTARACDFCARKRACWYCAADDAFLCQHCDYSVHTANPLARRHGRVRLKTTSFKSLNNINCAPSWHKGFAKKPQTPRGDGKHTLKNPFDVVPEVGYDDMNSHEEGVEQVLYRVPVCDNNHGLFVSSEIEVAEFDPDVEILLGKGVENECVGMEGLGLADGKEYEYEHSSWECCEDSGKVKVEMMMMGTEEAFELGFDCDDAPLTCEEVKEKIGLDEINNGGELKEINDEETTKKILLLQLDYEAVITAWATQKSPWTSADKPHLVSDHSMRRWGMELHRPYGAAMEDGGREARVSRYREKRRTRLFSKKIRYEVRKLNAEKRPRMKGRFVKTASFVAVPPPTLPLPNK
ncbi:zinc finger protein CONSTANS-LIKE 16-like [Abrus precatorius]|uniref:Zinc finger protein CONSTANS-LIKE 16-like n=1 Tax=Abrus precatorius TaxID=3816 RepID=A0A8B8M452_ABRPR|nr:zinc finger protein CONSTANS-LIKE 16-like [Abrus precatorius]